LIEKQKVLRKIRQVRRALGLDEDTSKKSKKNKSEMKEPLSEEERAKLEHQLKELELDLSYITVSLIGLLNGYIS
jgi:hypothetical protein